MPTGAGKTIIIDEDTKQEIQLAAQAEYEGDVGNVRKSEHWIAIGEALESQDYPQQKIAQEIQKLVSKELEVQYKKAKMQIPEGKLKLNSGYFYHIMRTRNWVTPYETKKRLLEGNLGNSSDKILAIPDSSKESKTRNELYNFAEDMITLCTLFQDQLQADVDEVKVDNATHTVNTPEGEPLVAIARRYGVLPSAIAALNPETTKAELIKAGTTLKLPAGILLKVARNWSKVLANMGVKDSDGLWTFARDLFYNSFEDFKRKAYDERQLILPQMRPATLAICHFATNTNYADEHYATVKQDQRITPKKLAQYLKDAKSFSDLCHLALEDAYRINFLDMKCPDCERYSLRISIHASGKWDLVCKNNDYHKGDLDRAAKGNPPSGMTPKDYYDMVKADLEIIQLGNEERYVRHYRPEMLAYRLKALEKNYDGASYEFLEKRYPDILRRLKNDPDADAMARLAASGEIKIDETEVV